jgi:hypothetical protein
MDIATKYLPYMQVTVKKWKDLQRYVEFIAEDSTMYEIDDYTKKEFNDYFMQYAGMETTISKSRGKIDNHHNFYNITDQPKYYTSFRDTASPPDDCWIEEMFYETEAQQQFNQQIRMMFISNQIRNDVEYSHKEQYDENNRRREAHEKYEIEDEANDRVWKTCERDGWDAP